MIKLLIIQENGRHLANREFRECFCMQRSWIKLGHQADVWGLGHDNFSTPPPFAAFDVILNLENYDASGWLPDLGQVPRFKLLWAIDEHCRDVTYYERLRRRDKVNVVLHSTQDFVVDRSDLWFPNCFDDALVSPFQLPCRADVGFCGSLLNRQPKLDLLRKHFRFQADILVLGQKMVEAVNSYRIHFNCNLGNDVNARSFETLGCGVPLATSFNRQYLDLGFVDGKNCIFYRNDQELVENVRWWLNHGDELAGLARNALELSKRHTYEARCRWLISYLQSAL